jgi:hypothetical protein
MLAKRNSFQVLIAVMMLTAMRPVLVSGSPILMKVPNLEQPSIMAASSNSWG